MVNRIPQPPQLNLSSQSERPLFVSMEAFFRFNFWMAEELTDLVEEYKLQERNTKLQNCLDTRACLPRDITSRN